MITVRDDDDQNDIFLNSVEHFTTASEAAEYLWTSVFNASKIFGGTARLIQPGDYPDYPYSHGVEWQGGPDQWADAYVVSEGASAPEFSADAAAGNAVLFTGTDA